MTDIAPRKITDMLKDPAVVAALSEPVPLVKVSLAEHVKRCQSEDSEPAIRGPQRDPLAEADAYRDSLPEDEADELSLARGEIAWLREAIRRFECATITAEQQADLTASV